MNMMKHNVNKHKENQHEIASFGIPKKLFEHILLQISNTFQ